MVAVVVNLVVRQPQAWLEKEGGPCLFRIVIKLLISKGHADRFDRLDNYLQELQAKEKNDDEK